MAPARAGGDHRGDEPRGRQLPHLLEGDDVLQPARADDLPARVRARTRVDGHRQRRRGALLRRVRRHRDGRDRGDLLQRPAGDVRHLRQAPLPAHLRRDPRRAGRRRGAGDGRGAVDLAPRPASTAASRCSSPSPSASIRPGGCCWCRSSPSSPRSASARSASPSPGTVAKIDQFNYVTTLVITPLFLVAGTFFPINQLPEGFQVAGPVQPALPAGRAGPRRRVRLRGGRRAAGRWRCSRSGSRCGASRSAR